ncbi:MAG TPA: amidase, partial [Stellaceae bacterium]|nr:amidase [Stellaceae bacterium]
MASTINGMSAVELAQAFEARRLSPVEVLDASLDRLAAVDPALNAFCLVDETTGRHMAKAAEARWHRGEPLSPLDGVPIALKDTAHAIGWPTRIGSRTTSIDPSTVDAPGIARLREAGAVFFGKTTTPEFGWKGLTHGPLTGISRNPWDASKTPGGSSGGAAIAVATGIVPLATGGDGGGSLRIPASFSGVYTVKPSFGLVPSFAANLGSLPVFGGLSRSVMDSAVFLRIISRPDPRDAFAIPFRDIDYTASLAGGVAGLRVAYSHDLGFPIVHPEVAAAVAAGVEHLSRAGARVEEVSLDLSGARRVIEIIWQAGFSGMLRHLSEAARQLLEPDLLDVVLSARALGAEDLQWAHDECRALGTRMQALHQDYDLLVTPTIPIPAFEVGINTPDPAAYPHWFDWTPFTWPFNLTGQPAASIPCGFTTGGLPIGLQIVAAKFREDLIFRASQAVE